MIALHFEFAEGKEGLGLELSGDIFHREQSRVGVHGFIETIPFHFEAGSRQEHIAHERRPWRVALDARIVIERRLRVILLQRHFGQGAERFVFLRRARVPLEHVAVEAGGQLPSPRGLGRICLLRRREHLAFRAISHNRRTGGWRVGQNRGFAEQCLRESGVGFLHGLRQGPDGSHGEHRLLFLFGPRAQGPEFGQVIGFFGVAFV